VTFEFYANDEVFTKHKQELMRKLGGLVAVNKKFADFQVYWHGSRIWMHAELTKPDIPEARRRLLEGWLNSETNKSSSGISLPDIDCLVIFPNLTPAELYQAKASFLNYSKEDRKKTEHHKKREVQSFAVPNFDKLDVCFAGNYQRAPLLSNFDRYVDLGGKHRDEDHEGQFQKFLDEDLILVPGFNAHMKKISDIDLKLFFNENEEKDEKVKAVINMAYVIKSLYKPLLSGKKLSVSAAKCIIKLKENTEYKNLKAAVEYIFSSKYIPNRKIPNIDAYWHFLVEEHARPILNESENNKQLKMEEVKKQEELENEKIKLAASLQQKIKGLEKSISEVKWEHGKLKQFSARTREQQEQNPSAIFIPFALMGQIILMKNEGKGKLLSQTIDLSDTSPYSIVFTDDALSTSEKINILDKLFKEIAEITSQQKSLRETLEKQIQENDAIMAKVALQKDKFTTDEEVASMASSDTSKNSDGNRSGSADSSGSNSPSSPIAQASIAAEKTKKKKKKQKKEVKKNDEKDDFNLDALPKHDGEKSQENILRSLVYEHAGHAENLLTALDNHEMLREKFKEDKLATFKLLFRAIKDVAPKNKPQILAKISPLFPKEGFKKDTDIGNLIQQAINYTNTHVPFGLETSGIEKFEIVEAMVTAFRQELDTSKNKNISVTMIKALTGIKNSPNNNIGSSNKLADSTLTDKVISLYNRVFYSAADLQDSEKFKEFCTGLKLIGVPNYIDIYGVDDKLATLYETLVFNEAIQIKGVEKEDQVWFNMGILYKISPIFPKLTNKDGFDSRFNSPDLIADTLRQFAAHYPNYMSGLKARPIENQYQVIKRHVQAYITFINKLPEHAHGMNFAKSKSYKNALLNAVNHFDVIYDALSTTQANGGANNNARSLNTNPSATKKPFLFLGPELCEMLASQPACAIDLATYFTKESSTLTLLKDKLAKGEMAYCQSNDAQRVYLGMFEIFDNFDQIQEQNRNGKTSINAKIQLLDVAFFNMSSQKELIDAFTLPGMQSLLNHLKTEIKRHYTTIEAQEEEKHNKAIAQTLASLGLTKIT
jgi:hypothetical protein